MTQKEEKAISSGSPSTCKSKIELVEKTNTCKALRGKKKVRIHYFNGTLAKANFSRAAIGVSGFRVSQDTLTSFLSSVSTFKGRKHRLQQLDCLTSSWLEQNGYRTWLSWFQLVKVPQFKNCESKLAVFCVLDLQVDFRHV